MVHKLSYWQGQVQSSLHLHTCLLDTSYSGCQQTGRRLMVVQRQRLGTQACWEALPCWTVETQLRIVPLGISGYVQSLQSSDLESILSHSQPISWVMSYSLGISLSSKSQPSQDRGDLSWTVPERSQSTSIY